MGCNTAIGQWQGERIVHLSPVINLEELGDNLLQFLSYFLTRSLQAPRNRLLPKNACLYLIPCKLCEENLISRVPGTNKISSSFPCPDLANLDLANGLLLHQSSWPCIAPSLSLSTNLFSNSLPVQILPLAQLEAKPIKE